MKYIFTLMLTVVAVNANAIWMNKTLPTHSKDKFMYQPSVNLVDNKKQQRSQALDTCFKECVIDVDMLKQCRQHAQSKKDKAACISFSKRECLMRCKEQDFKRNTVSLLTN